jgi:uncharacterized protein YbaR (Trm112 family)
MYIELIDLLRCPREHADSWLVVAFNKMDGRFVVEGKLGCPVCSSSYRIREGIADLRRGEVSEPNAQKSEQVSDADAAMRAAALLGLTKPNSLIVLAGSSAGLAHEVSAIADARVLALNPDKVIEESEKVAVIRADDRLPFAPGSIDGIMLDEATAAFAHDASRTLRQGGRLIAPRGMTLPKGLRELARDDK